MTEHPITPSPEMVEQWMKQWRDTSYNPFHFYCYIAARAAQWGADQELEACCDWLFREPVTHEIVGRDGRYLDFELRAARRPKPPSLKEQALAILAAAGGPDYPTQMTVINTDEHILIKRALEALPQ